MARVLADRFLDTQALRSDELGPIVAIIRRWHPHMDVGCLPRLEVLLALASWRSQTVTARAEALICALDLDDGNICPREHP